MMKHIQIFLGFRRIQAIFLLLAVTGLGNLILNRIVHEVDWAQDAQTALVAVFILGSMLVVGSALEPYERGRWAGILAPAVIAFLIGAFAAPDLLPLFLGGAFGWMVAAVFIFKARGPMEYQRAVKHMRKSEYEQAVQVLDALIKTEPDKANHYRFRAEVLRLWGKLDRARRDYEKMAAVAADDLTRAVAVNGLAEVLLQSGKFEAAHAAARQAYELSPGEWVAAYNLGLIEDRLKRAQDAIVHLDQALAARVPDARHRLLIHFYRARAYARLGDFAAAQDAVNAVKKHRGGLNEWDILLQSEQAQTLREVLEADIAQTHALVDDELDVKALADD